MALPLSLADWTIEHIRTVADDFEPGWFDFKEVLRSQDPRHAPRIREAACAMANTDGGFLVFGVVDRGNRMDGKDPVPGIDLSGKTELRKEFGDVIDGINRDIRFESSPSPIAVNPTGTRGVFVIHVLKSLLGPHELDGIFWKRGDKGACKRMDFYDVREQMIATEDRMRKVRLIRLELQEIIQTSQAMGEGNENLARDRFETDAFKTLVADTCAILPPEGCFIEKLLRIPRIARRANTALDRLNAFYIENYPAGTISSHSEPANRRRAELYAMVASDRKEVVSLCQESEEVFKRRFGSLTGA
jgi:hypothetical protein